MVRSLGLGNYGTIAVDVKLRKAILDGVFITSAGTSVRKHA